MEKSPAEHKENAEFSENRNKKIVEIQFSANYLFSAGVKNIVI